MSLFGTTISYYFPNACITMRMIYAEFKTEKNSPLSAYIIICEIDFGSVNKIFFKSPIVGLELAIDPPPPPPPPPRGILYTMIF